MSTEHQSYSIDNQRAAIAAWAESHGYQVVRSYADEAVSGLRLDGRTALKALLADVLGGQADFDAILTYDVSRWGRFQDPDQGAHYEFLCREAGVRVEYCAEPFENDGSLTSTLFKSLKRAMAAEYSRELSVKVAHAQRRLAEKGFWIHGPCPLGYRRLMTDRQGRPRMMLEAGERKGLQGHHCVLVLGPPQEVRLVRRIFRLCSRPGTSTIALARRLNLEGLRAEGGARWTGHRIRSLLRNETYVGTAVLGRATQRLGARTPQPKSTWVRVENAWPAVVTRASFERARRALRKSTRPSSPPELIEELKDLLARHGRLSTKIIRDDPASHCVATYVTRLGGLHRAFELAGYTPTPRQRGASERLKLRRATFRPEPQPKPTDEDLLARLRTLAAEHGFLSTGLINSAPGPCASIYCRRFGGMRRAYALAGYTPSERQERSMERRGGQSISRVQADALRVAGAR